MNQVEANCEALETLRQSLDRFFYEQKAATDRAAWLAGAMIDDLEHAERRWRMEAEHCEVELHRCLEEARYAAAHGGYIDCSGWSRGLADSQHNLGILALWRGRVEQASDHYLATKGSLQHWFDFDLPRAKHYLDNRIKALRAFLAAAVRRGG